MLKHSTVARILITRSKNGKVWTELFSEESLSPNFQLCQTKHNVADLTNPKNDANLLFSKLVVLPSISSGINWTLQQAEQTKVRCRVMPSFIIPPLFCYLSLHCAVVVARWYRACLKIHRTSGAGLLPFSFLTLSFTKCSWTVQHYWFFH